MKKGVILVPVVMALFITIGCNKIEKQKEGHSSTVITSGGEVVSAYRDGKDVTDERKALEEQTKDTISRFLNREKKELEFSMFCMLETDGMSIEVIIDEVSYTFFCSMQGDIISIGRTDGETFGLRGLVDIQWGDVVPDRFLSKSIRKKST